MISHESNGSTNVQDSLQSKKVLMVGAGGIGCELLKDLVMIGFGTVEIVDLDTIDLSNLNRQFLFQAKHIKEPKAMVAKQVVDEWMRPSKLTAHHGNIKDTVKFSFPWFASFNLVFNALDNIEARRHVNRMCLMTNVPLIECGSTGYQGQAYPIIRGRTPCYDCFPVPPPKSFAVCTIRSTPSEPIHCILWAKSYLLPQLFGEAEELQPTSEDDAEEIKGLQREANELTLLRESKGGMARLVFEKVFMRDIERLAGAEVWKGRRAPKALTYSDPHYHVLGEQSAGTLEDNLALFNNSLSRLAARGGEIVFDKDDIDTLDFVTASANLRSLVFGIPLKSRFEVKQIAGNIIPAIATTNAIIAGACVMAALQILAKPMKIGPKVYLVRRPHQPRPLSQLLASERHTLPNPDCEVCSGAMGIVQITMSTTVADFVSQLKNFRYEEVSLLSQNLLYDPDFDDNLESPLSDFVASGSFITVIDDAELKPNLNLGITVGDTFEFPELQISLPSNGVKRKMDAATPEEEPAHKKVRQTEGVEIIEDGLIELD